GSRPKRPAGGGRAGGRPAGSARGWSGPACPGPSRNASGIPGRSCALRILLASGPGPQPADYRYGRAGFGSAGAKGGCRRRPLAARPGPGSVAFSCCGAAGIGPAPGLPGPVAPPDRAGSGRPSRATPKPAAPPQPVGRPGAAAAIWPAGLTALTVAPSLTAVMPGEAYAVRGRESQPREGEP